MICLGKVSEHFSRATKEKVLLPAFVQGLGDSFAPGRQHSLSALVREACHTAAPRGPTPRAREQTTPPLPPCSAAAPRCYSHMACLRTCLASQMRGPRAHAQASLIAHCEPATCASSVLPKVAPLTLDLDAGVRKQALKCSRAMLTHIEKQGEKMEARPVPAALAPRASPR